MSQSWILILRPNHNRDIHGAMPAIIGGYSSREEADAAGKIAVDFWGGNKEFELQWHKANPHGGVLPRRDWDSFIVIPGSASMGPTDG